MRVGALKGTKSDEKLYEKVQFPFGVLKGHRASPDVSQKVPFGSPVEKNRNKIGEEKSANPRLGKNRENRGKPYNNTL